MCILFAKFKFRGRALKRLVRVSGFIMQGFASEIVSDILSRLSAEDIIQCKTVCKSWYECIKTPHFIHLHLTRTLSQSRRRILLQPGVDEPGHREHLIYVDNTNGKWTCGKIPLWHSSGEIWHVTHSYIGLICLSKLECNGEGPVVCNPITKDCLTLPDSMLKPREKWGFTKLVDLGLGFDPVNNKYKVVRVYNVFTETPTKIQTHGEILTVGERSWRTLCFPHTVLSPVRKNSVFQNGAFHWLMEAHPCLLEKVLTLDITSEKFNTISSPSSIRLPQCLDLVSFGEAAALISYSGGSLQIWEIVDSRLHRRIIDISGLTNNPARSFGLANMLSNGNLLFETSEVGVRYPERDGFVLYNPQEKTPFILEVSGIPKSFVTKTVFVPSLVSPISLSS